jgi:hypothetical protein
MIRFATLTAFLISVLLALLGLSTQTERTKTSQAQGTEPAPSPSPSPSKFIKSKKPIPNRYIVVLRDDVVRDDATLEVRRAGVAAIAASHAQTYGGQVDYIYETALKGYAIQQPNEAAAIAISELAEVKWVEEDAYGSFDSAPEARPQARKFDEFIGEADYEALIARLDNFAIELQKQPTAQGQIIVYRTRSAPASVGRSYARNARDYLVRTRGLDSRRVLTVDGGMTGCLMYELWIVPPGAPPPERRYTYQFSLRDSVDYTPPAKTKKKLHR